MAARMPAWMLLAGLLAAVTGCETVVDVDLPEAPPRLVVHSVYAAGAPWRATVTHTVGVLTDDDIELVPDAEVAVWRDGQVVARLNAYDPESGTYRAASGEAPVPGAVYTLRAAAPGYDAVEATAAVPLPPAVEVDVQTRPVAVDGYTVRRHTITLRLDDPAGSDDAYALLFDRADSLDGQPLSLGGAWFSSRDAAVLAEDGFEDFDDERTFEGDEAVFTDRVFDGRTYTLTATMDDFAGYGADGPTGITSVLIVRLRRLSPDYYAYLRSRRAYDQNEDNPFAEPANLHSNVEGGYGLFAGFAETAVTVVLEP